MANVKTSWAIRSYSKEAGSNDWVPFMETYFATREKMRSGWRNQPEFMKSSAFFKSERFRVVDYAEINKRSYSKAR